MRNAVRTHPTHPLEILHDGVSQIDPGARASMAAGRSHQSDRGLFLTSTSNPHTPQLITALGVDSTNTSMAELTDNLAVLIDADNAQAPVISELFVEAGWTAGRLWTLMPSIPAECRLRPDNG